MKHYEVRWDGSGELKQGEDEIRKVDESGIADTK